MGIRRKVIDAVVPDVHKVAPKLNRGFIHQTLLRAINGVGPLPSAAAVAEKHLRDNEGAVDQAVNDVVKTHTGLAAGEGFVTNLGGLTTAPATIPANIAGLALLQCRMVATIAHLRGYDLSDGRVRNAILLCVLGEDAVKQLVRKRRIPGRPSVLVTAPVHDPELDALVAGEVTSALISRVIGKRAAGTVIRRVPVAGGVWGASSDGWNTWQVGRYAARELMARRHPH
ncbi:EcsC family protein [Nocardioides marmoribigeumensis]|jgi:hypothetical protein|uniref:Uncharacterized protein (DUF697 family) n=1 Tax=Nocardioides marmoribigeumensis TaxID=433649 RepID=A0ABU2BV33_9ACTN|nr:EcsC family protein [Nocardioides marmoribigeumensis]MDR7362485.1 uncharacterized protein (DUF697 family) [Nocardioides marmoribigeumensis]